MLLSRTWTLCDAKLSKFSWFSPEISFLERRGREERKKETRIVRELNFQTRGNILLNLIHKLGMEMSLPHSEG